MEIFLQLLVNKILLSFHACLQTAPPGIIRKKKIKGTDHFPWSTRHLHTGSSRRSTVCFVVLTRAQVHMFSNSCTQSPFKAKKKKQKPKQPLLNLSFISMSNIYKSKRKYHTVVLTRFLRRSCGNLIVPPGQYSPIFVIFAPSVEPVMFQYRMS